MRSKLLPCPALPAAARPCSRLQCWMLITIGVLSTIAGPARAEGPEQFYEPGPGAGRWSLEYNGQFGRTGGAERPHSVELFRGVSERVAVGVEVEGESEGGEFAIEELGLGAIIALTGKDAAFQTAMLVQAGVTTAGDFPQLEARLIARRAADRWHALGNIIVRHVDRDHRWTELGYAFALHREIADEIRLGLELSGQAARLGGAVQGFEAGHYAGPSLSAEFDVGGEREIEVGLKYLKRVDSAGAYEDNARLVLSLRF